MVRFRPLPVGEKGRKKNCRTVKICRRSKPITGFGNRWSGKLIDLTKGKKRVFVHLNNGKAMSDFLKQAEYEGFTINGKLPTHCKCENNMILHSDYTISYMRSWSAHAAYGAGEGKKVEYGNI